MLLKCFSTVTSVKIPSSPRSLRSPASFFFLPQSTPAVPSFAVRVGVFWRLLHHQTNSDNTITITSTTAAPISTNFTASLVSELLGSKRAHDFLSRVLTPALFTASTHTLVPGARSPSSIILLFSLASRTSSSPSTYTRYCVTVEGGSHHRTTTTPLLSKDRLWREGGSGGSKGPLIPGQEQNKMSESF